MAAQRDASINYLLADLRGGHLQSVVLPQSNLLLETGCLSEIYTERFGSRRLEILQVAMAIVFGSDRFLTFDPRRLQGAPEIDLRGKTTSLLHRPG